MGEGNGNDIPNWHALLDLCGFSVGPRGAPLVTGAQFPPSMSDQKQPHFLVPYFCAILNRVGVLIPVTSTGRVCQYNAFKEILHFLSSRTWTKGGVSI